MKPAPKPKKIWCRRCGFVHFEWLGCPKQAGIDAIIALADAFGYGVGQMLDVALKQTKERR